MKKSRFAAWVVGLLGLLAFPKTSEASFHLWKIQEVYSNATGSVQFIELVDTSNGENLVNTKTITANSDGTVRTFTFHSNLGSTATASKTILIATPGFAALPGAVTPDYTLPCGPFFDPAAASITISYSGGLDSITFAGSSLPTTGTNSLIDSMPTASDSTHLAAGASSPTNFAGTAGALALTGCIEAGTCEPCDDGQFCNGAETCSGSACAAGTPCTMICDEGADTCVECNDATVCDDSNDCTDDTCPSHSCVHTNNSNPCDDGLFCTAIDTCAGGSCVGTGDPCTVSADGGIDGGNTDGGSQQCLEGLDICGNCSAPSDCDDADPCTVESCTAGVCGHAAAADGTACASNGLFCDGIEQCVSGVCESPGDPCSLSETCNESGNQCEALCSGVCSDAGADGGAVSDGGNGIVDASSASDASSGGGPNSGGLDSGVDADAGDHPYCMVGPECPEPPHHYGLDGSVAAVDAGFSGDVVVDGGQLTDDTVAKSSSGCGCSIPRRAPMPVAPGLFLAFALVFRRVSRRQS